MKNKGITLIALVITIIVLLILAGITINLTIGEHGILIMAKQAGKNYQNAAEYEQGAIGNFFNEAQNIIAGGNGNGTGTNPGDTGRPTSVVELGDTLISNYYGDRVNYSANGIEDWKLFYKDANGEVFIIASDCIPASKVPTASTGSVTSGDYNVYWNTVPTFQSNWSTNANLFIQPFQLRSNYDNSKVVSTLLNTNNWGSFVNTNYADLAIGGPTVRMFASSYDEKSGTNYLGRLGASDYGVTYSKNAPDTPLINIDTSDELYFPHTDYVGTNCGYVLATPHGAGTTLNKPNVICTVQYTNGLNSMSINLNKFGIRPVVHLKTGIMAQWNETTNMWNLQSK